LRHHTHAWAYLQHRNIRTGIYRIGYTAGYCEVSQEMLTEVLLGSYLLHGDKIKKKTADMKICGSELFNYSQILLVLKINLVVYVHCLSNYDGRHGQCKHCYHHFLFTFLFFNPLNVILVNLLPFDDIDLFRTKKGTFIDLYQKKFGFLLT